MFGITTDLTSGSPHCESSLPPVSDHDLEPFDLPDGLQCETSAEDAPPNLEETGTNTQDLLTENATGESDGAAFSEFESRGGTMFSFNMGSPRSGDRGQFTQNVARNWFNHFNRPAERRRRHVMVVYHGSRWSASLYQLLSSDGSGNWNTGPSRTPSGFARFHNWGVDYMYVVYVFERGDFTLHSEGGFENWCFISPSYRRNGQSVLFLDAN